MPDVQKIEADLNRVMELVTNIKKHLHEDLQTQEPSEETSVETASDLIKLANHEKWPEAVNSNIICDPNDPKEKQDRGRGIINLMVEEDLKGMKFLDFGCGEGHSVDAAKEAGAIESIGYDVKVDDQWKDNCTNEFEIVKSKGPYDVVLMYDVLDHIENESPIDVLKKIHQVMKPDGKMYMRCHPWTSRHATHMYQEKNKAFLHLVFTEKELKEMFPEVEMMHNIGVKYPINEYNEFVKNAGFIIESRREIKEEVENFFKIPLISERILKNTKMDEFPEFQMSLQWVDYILKKA